MACTYLEVFFSGFFTLSTVKPKPTTQQPQVVINPAYQIPEIEYAIKKVGVKAIYIPERYLSQRYYEMLAQLAPELATSKPGELQSSKLPSLSAVIVDSESGGKLP